MSLDTIVNLQITRQTTAPTRVGFGIPLIAAYHTVIPDIVAPFSTLGALTDAGFAVTDPAYRAAQVAFSQNPSPSLVCVGKRTLAPTRIVQAYPLNVKTGYIYKFSLVEYDGTTTVITYTVQASDTVALVGAALLASAGSPASVTMTFANSTHLVFTAKHAGQIFDLTGLPNAKNLKIADVTVDPGIATDLAAILEADPLTWYGLTLDSQSPAETMAAAAWCEATRKIFLADTTDSAVLDSTSTTDVAYLIKGSSYARTGVLFSANRIQSYSAMAWMARQLPKDPGSSSWMFKTLAGILTDVFTDGQMAQLIAKRCNSYTNVGGIPITAEGWTGDGGFLDVAHGADWLYARIQEAVYGGLANAEKIPYTDGGVATIVNLILGVLKRGIKAGFLAADPAPTCTAPKVADADVSDKINRILSGVTFQGTLAGAIHHVIIRGVLSA